MYAASPWRDRSIALYKLSLILIIARVVLGTIDMVVRLCTPYHSDMEVMVLKSLFHFGRSSEFLWLKKTLVR